MSSWVKHEVLAAWVLTAGAMSMGCGGSDSSPLPCRSQTGAACEGAGPWAIQHDGAVASLDGAAPGAGGPQTVDPNAGSGADSGVPSGPGQPGTGQAGQPTGPGTDTQDGGTPPAAQPTSGCGAATFPASGTYTMDVGGTQRTYIVTLPTGYDASKPYKLVFAWHGLGGTAAQIAGTGSAWGASYAYYGLQSRAQNSTIFVAGQGLDTGMGGAGWPNTNGRDVAFTKQLLDQLEKQYCVDQKRIFSVGMSYGGIMSNTLGCQMGDVFRAIGVMSGMGPNTSPYAGGGACKGQVAVWMDHGNMDSVVPFSQGQSSRDFWVKANHCSSTTMPTDPSPCVAYTGCDSGFPVHWCEFDGDHTIPAFAADGIWNFLSQF